MLPENKAAEMISKYGKDIALEIANMLFTDHQNYTNPYTSWRGEFREVYTNAEMTDYWGKIRNIIENS